MDSEEGMMVVDASTSRHGSVAHEADNNFHNAIFCLSKNSGSQHLQPSGLEFCDARYPVRLRSSFPPTTQFRTYFSHQYHHSNVKYDEKFDWAKFEGALLIVTATERETFDRESVVWW